MSNVIHDRFAAAGLAAACARIRAHTGPPNQQIVSDAQFLTTELGPMFHWLEGCARRQRVAETRERRKMIVKTASVGKTEWGEAK